MDGSIFPSTNGFFWGVGDVISIYILSFWGFVCCIVVWI